MFFAFIFNISLSAYIKFISCCCIIIFLGKTLLLYDVYFFLILNYICWSFFFTNLIRSVYVIAHTVMLWSERCYNDIKLGLHCFPSKFIQFLNYAGIFMTGGLTTMAVPCLDFSSNGFHYLKQTCQAHFKYEKLRIEWMRKLILEWKKIREENE